MPRQVAQVARLYFEDLEVGATWETRGRTITEADLVTYAGLSGNFESIHMDEEFARATSFGSRLAHGPLVLDIAIGLGNLDGPRMATLAGTELHCRFLKPVKIGDTIHVRWMIEDKVLDEARARGRIVSRLDVYNQREELVQEAHLVRLVVCRPAARQEFTGGSTA